MNNNVIYTTLIIGLGLTLAIIVLLGFKLLQAFRNMHTQLKDLHGRFGETRKQIDQLSVAIDLTARETQNAVYLTQLDLHMPVFMGGWSIDTFLGKFLVQHLIEAKPMTILELGSGTSTVLIARTLQLMGINNCEHLAVDHEAKYLAISRDYARLNGLEDRVTWLECPLQRHEELDKLWYGRLTGKLAGKKIDLLLVDGPPGPLQPLSRYPALPILAPFLAERCTVVLDDAARRDEQEIIRRWQSEFPGFTLDLIFEGHGVAVLSRQ